MSLGTSQDHYTPLAGAYAEGVQWVTGNPPFQINDIVHVQAWRIGRVNGHHQILGCCRVECRAGGRGGGLNKVLHIQG